MSDFEMRWLEADDWSSARQREQLVGIWQQAHLARLCEVLKELEIRPLLVGGIVRDLVLGRESDDIDLVIPVSGEVLMSHGLFLKERMESSLVPLDAERGILRLCFRDSTEIDLVSLQAPTLLRDLTRRDITINALACDPQGRIADPCNGFQDLRDGIVRVVKEENIANDPLRTLRCFRFAAQLNFELESESRAIVFRHFPALSRVAGERISSELRKFFSKASSQLKREFFQANLGGALALTELASPRSSEYLQVWQAFGELAFPLPLAFLFGLDDSDAKKLVFERFRMSSTERKGLEEFALALESLANTQAWELEEIFLLMRSCSRVLRELVSLLTETPFPVQLSGTDRETLMRELKKEGHLNWEPLPWSGGEVLELLQLQGGPWTGKFMNHLELMWACGKLKDESQIPELHRKFTTPVD